MNIKNIQGYKDKHKGERCFILGNGPSLNDVDLTELNGIVIGTNRIYLSGYIPDYYCCVNPLVFDQWGDEILAMDTVKFLPQMFIDNVQSYKDIQIAGDNVPIITNNPFPGFAKDAREPMWEGHTVTYVCMQLAYYMGFNEVILLGVDHDYGEKEDNPNQEEVYDGKDKYHFHEEYFSDAMWNKPDLRRSEIAYSLAKAAYESAGREIINCSTRTKLTIFPLDNLNRINPFNVGINPRVSAIVSAYHADEYIDQCLYDLNEQTEVPEIVVVCQEGSKEHEIAARRNRLKIVLTEDIPTVYQAWNLGIKAATGKYITNANTDDRHHFRAYEILADILDARDDIDLVYHDQFVSWTPNQGWKEFVADNQDKKLVNGRHEGEPGHFTWYDYDKSQLIRGCYIGPQPMWRASLHKRYGYFDEKMRSAGDYDFWLRIARDNNFLHVPYLLGVYLARSDGIELSDPQTNLIESIEAVINNSNGSELRMGTLADNTTLVEMGGKYSISDTQKLVEGLEQWIKGMMEQ